MQANEPVLKTCAPFQKNEKRHTWQKLELRGRTKSSEGVTEPQKNTTFADMKVNATHWQSVVKETGTSLPQTGGAKIFLKRE